MWIFLSILALLIVLITVIMLLPVFVIIKIDEQNKLYLRYKFLNKTFGEHPDPNNPIVKALKRVTGASRLEKDAIKESIEKTSLLKTLRDDLDLLSDLIRELFTLFKHCKANVFKLRIVCTADNAADAAITYGECCAIAYPTLGYLHSLLNIKRSGESIDISCDYESEKNSFAFETVLIVRVFRVIGALLRTAKAESKRNGTENNANSNKN